MTSRLTKRVGFSAFAKHSKMVFNPKRLPSPLQESVSYKSFVYFFLLKHSKNFLFLCVFYWHRLVSYKNFECGNGKHVNFTFKAYSKVKEGIKALIAKDPTDDTDQWTKAPMLEKRRMGYNSEREDFLCQQPILAQDRFIKLK